MIPEVSTVLQEEKVRLNTCLSGQIISLGAALAGLITVLCNQSAAAGQVEFIIPLLRFDSTSLFLISAIFFIGSVVTAYSQRYLIAWTKRVEFVEGVTLLASISAVMAASNNLLLSMAAWTGISICLWHLIKMSPGASESASRVLRYHLYSDILFATATISICLGYGCFEFGKLSELTPKAALAFEIAGLSLSITNLEILSTILVLSFIIKSALFPFHGWLLATLDAPTPLSGLLHAGVVNIAAVAAARFFPLLQESSFALYTLAFFGSISALFGTQLMSVQSDVKRKLVYSTVGQMGFMCLQCATGLIPLAIFHLIAHGLFKCHLFLISGSAVEEGKIKASWGIEREGGSKTNAYILAAITLIALGFILTQNIEANLVASVLVATLAILLLQIPSVARINLMFMAVAASAALCAGLLSHQSMHLFAETINYGNWQLDLFLLSVGCIFSAQFLILLLRKTEMGAALYVMYLNRFYIEELFSNAIPSRVMKEKLQ
ncbi:MAG: hypothetical protein KC652_10845 [Cyanobacteria bacterium HKST-UBA01]|nr:hypothetical protein [Cyanobacteria bacterium HKST-UBA01]